MTGIGSHLALGFGFAAVVGAIAWRVRALDLWGAIAAVFVGGLIFGLGGLWASSILIAFFVSGTILSKLPGGPKPLTGDEKRGRNWKQVLANGGFATAAILFAQIPRFHFVGLYAYLGALAAATSDSWSTEIGTRYGSNPRDFLTWKVIDRGVSGGISGMGILAAIGGASLIAAVAILPVFDVLKGSHIQVGIAVILAGFAGSTADSMIGSGMQAKYRCSVCGDRTEISEHCSCSAILISGYKKVKNNTVNFAASAISALIVVLLLDLAP